MRVLTWEVFALHATNKMQKTLSMLQIVSYTMHSLALQARCTEFASQFLWAKQCAAYKPFIKSHHANISIIWY